MRRRELLLTVTLGLIGMTLLQGSISREFDRAAQAASPRGVDAGFPLDDAWIHHVYARSLSERGRLEYNEGNPEAGQSSLLWGALLVPIASLHRATDLPLGHLTRGLGTLIWILVALTAAWLVAILPVPGAKFGAVAVSLFVAFDPSLAYAANSGMEPLLLALFGLLALGAAVDRRYLLAGFAVGLATLARPEGILFAIAPTISLLGDSSSRRARASAKFLIPAMVLPSTWVAFCLSATGHPLPNTWYVKRTLEGPSDLFSKGSEALEGISLLAAELGRSPLYESYIAFLFLGIGLLSLFFRTKRQVWVTLIGVPLLFFIATAVTRELILPEAFFWQRYLLPLGRNPAASMTCDLREGSFRQDRLVRRLV